MSIIKGMPQSFVYVPQGCYAEIINTPTVKTPDDIIGLMTAGMDPCCHVIVANKETGHMILCHVDSVTDLTDVTHGIPAWVQKICPEGNYNNLIVNVGEKENASRFTSAKDNNPIFNQVRDCLKEINHNIKPESFNVEAGEGYGILIHRTTCEIEKIDCAASSEAKEQISNKYKVPILELTLKNGHLFESSLARNRDYADTVNQYNNPESSSLRFPPICVFNGFSDNFLSLDDGTVVR